MESNSNSSSGSSKEIYECVFCKRGFTTAQALGGHMNVHRKDRAKAAGPSSVPLPASKPEDYNCTSFRCYSYPPATMISQNVPADYNCFKSSEEQVSNICYQSRFFPVANRGFKEDWCTSSLGLQISPSSSRNDERNRKLVEDINGELDLELRLGHS